MAARVKDRVHRPVVAFAPEETGSSRLKGSARSVRGLHIRDVLASVDARHPGLIPAFGGHAMAAGLTLEQSHLERFRGALESAVTEALDGADLAAEILTDGSLAAAELSLETALRIEDAGPWGQRFPEPLFDDRFRVLDARVVGGSHLKMIVEHREGSEPLDAIAFSRLPEDLPNGGSARFLYRLGVNRWRGSESCQLLIEEIRD